MIFIRHPQPDLGPGICYGRLDIAPLGCLHDMALDLAKSLQPSPVLISSPAKRCQDLAAELANIWGIGLQIEPDLQELSFGEWEGCNWDDIPRAEIDHWATDPLNIAPPGGETFQALLDRLQKVLNLTLGKESKSASMSASKSENKSASKGKNKSENKKTASKPIYITHAGIIRAALMILQKKSFDEVFATDIPYLKPFDLSKAI